MIMNMTGGAPALNFKIVGGTAAPDSPKERTIWVNTSEDVTCWALSYAEPAEPVEGMVWVRIGVAGRNVFNALKKNTLAVSPMQAMQYMDGAWVSRDAQIWLDGQWNDFVFCIVKDGGVSIPLICLGKHYNAQYTGAWTSGSVTPGDGYVSVGGDSDGYGIVYVPDIDLTEYSRLTIEGTFQQTGVMCKLIVWSELGTYITSNMVVSDVLPQGDGSVSLDVSGLTGIHTVGISSVASDKQIITNFYLS